MQLTWYRLHCGQAFRPRPAPLSSVLGPSLPLSFQGPVLMLQASYFTDEETEAQKGKMTSPRLSRSSEYQGHIYPSSVRILSDHIFLALDPSCPIGSALKTHMLFIPCSQPITAAATNAVCSSPKRVLFHQPSNSTPGACGLEPCLL